MNDIISSLSASFGLKPEQTESAAGTLFQLLQQKAAPTDFQQLLGALPQIGEWLGKAAPAPAEGAAAATQGAGGLLGGLLAGSSTLGPVLAALQSIGLTPETVMRFVPALLDQVRAHVDPALIERLVASVPALKPFVGGEGAAGGLGGMLLGKLFGSR